MFTSRCTTLEACAPANPDALAASGDIGDAISRFGSCVCTALNDSPRLHSIRR